MPWSFDVATVGCRVPADVPKVTGTPPTGLPLSSCTSAESVEVPPDGPRFCGLAERTTVLTAAVPIVSASVPLVPPEKAVMVAVPERPSPVNFTVTLAVARARLARVDRAERRREGDGRAVVDRRALARRRRRARRSPRPPFSITVAVMSVVPLADSVLVVANRLMTDPLGASSGRCWQPASATAAANATEANEHAAQPAGRRERASKVW